MIEERRLRAEANAKLAPLQRAIVDISNEAKALRLQLADAEAGSKKAHQSADQFSKLAAADKARADKAEGKISVWRNIAFGACFIALILCCGYIQTPNPMRLTPPKHSTFYFAVALGGAALVHPRVADAAFLHRQHPFAAWSSGPSGAIANGYDKGLATTLDYLRGLSRFAALNFTAMFFGMLGWPTMCHFSAFKWSDGWYAIGIKGQMVAFLGLAGVQIIAAAICFSA
jgi:hypothetical protein